MARIIKTLPVNYVFIPNTSSRFFADEDFDHDYVEAAREMNAVIDKIQEVGATHHYGFMNTMVERINQTRVADRKHLLRSVLVKFREILVAAVQSVKPKAKEYILR